MASRRHAHPLHHPIVITFLILAVIAFMSLAAEVLKPLAFAILLSFALAPIARFLEARGIPRFAAVLLTVVLTLGLLGAVGYKVGEQLTTLASQTDASHLKENILKKFRFLKPKQQGAIQKLSNVGADLAKTLDRPSQVKGTVPVNVVAAPTYTQRLSEAVGPYLESLGVASFVLILVLFMLANREDLSDRVIRLGGPDRVSVTTRTLEEVSQRISRYLTMFTLVNSAFGTIVALGLWGIGIPLALLWGVLAGLLRFVPYVGPSIAFGLPFLFSLANFEGWREPLLIFALFGVLEIAANSFLEPVLYGKTTGVSALGLLVAAMFWTWLWGALGLLLSTPLTVCLAVLGKYVPALRVFATLLDEEPPLAPDLRFYQRLIAYDQDGASEIIECELKRAPRVEVFDRILIPALSRTERDARRGEIDDQSQAFILRFVSDLLDELEDAPEVDLKSLAAGSPEVGNGPDPVEGLEGTVLGVAANDAADALALRMLDVLLRPLGCSIAILADASPPLKLAEKISSLEPSLVVLSHLPPGGFTTARYLVRRLRVRFADLPIVVGRWGESGNPEGAADRLAEMGASDVVNQLADARDRILEVVRPSNKTERATSSKSPVPVSTIP
ncbi:AI-2E family transporter [Singulisphaera rosea]